jgi:hypothetical protein
MRTEHIGGVCADCVHVAASGAPTYDGYADTGHGERYGRGVNEWGGEPYSDDTEPYFSWSPCVFCGDPLGGDRYNGTVLVTQ